MGVFDPNVLDSNVFDTGDDAVVVTPGAAISISSAVSPVVILGSLLLTAAAAIASATAVDPTVLTAVVIEPGPAITLAFAEDPVTEVSDGIIPEPAVAQAVAVDPLVTISDAAGLTVDLSSRPAIASAAAAGGTVVESVIVVIPAAAMAMALAVDPTVLLGQSFDLANRAAPVKGLLYRVSIDGYPDVLINYPPSGSPPPATDVPYIREIEPFRKSINDLEGNATMGDLVVVVVDKDRSITADFPGFLFEGKAITLKVGLEGLAETDFEILFAGFIDRVEGGENNLEWRIVCKDRSILLRQTIYETGDDGVKISAEHPRLLVGHPLDLLTAILWQECALPESTVDWTTINKYRDQLFFGMKFSFTLTSAVEAKQFIEQELLRPLGGWLHLTRKGVATVRFFFPVPGETEPVHSLTANNVIGIPVPEEAELINVLQHRYDGDTTTPHQTVTKDPDSVALYGLESLNPIDSQGMRASLGGASISRTVAAMLFDRYGGKPLMITALCFFDAILVETGDFILLTHPHIPDRAAGAMGLTNRKMEVLARTWYFTEGRVELVLLDASGLCAEFRVAPDGKPGYGGASAPDRARYMYVADDATEAYANGDPAHQLG